MILLKVVEIGAKTKCLPLHYFQGVTPPPPRADSSEDPKYSGVRGQNYYYYFGVLKPTWQTILTLPTVVVFRSRPLKKIQE